MRLDEAFKLLLKCLDRRLHQLRTSDRRGGYSNFGEEEILRELVANWPPPGPERVAVDIGASDGRRGSNTLSLFRDGWRGVGVESDARRFHQLAKTYKYFPGVAACRLRVTPHNVAPLLEAYGVGRNFGVLSLDIDSYDYWVLEAVLSSHRPAIVITEINEKFPPPIKFRVKYAPDFQPGHHFYGYSVSCLLELCQRFGYALVRLEYNNAFLVPEELARGCALPAEEAYRQGYLDRPDRGKKFPRNQDVEVLHSLGLPDQLDFIRQFFSRREGEYELTAGEAPGPATFRAKSLEPAQQAHKPLEPAVR